jgi:hypothetical protein
MRVCLILHGFSVTLPGAKNKLQRFRHQRRLVQSRTAMFDNLVWWGEALKAARHKADADSFAA